MDTVIRNVYIHMNTVSQVLKLIPTDMHIHMQNENKIRNLNEVKTIELKTLSPVVHISIEIYCTFIHSSHEDGHN